MDRGAWWATVHGVAKSWTRLSDSHFDGQSFGRKSRDGSWEDGDEKTDLRTSGHLPGVTV